MKHKLLSLFILTSLLGLLLSGWTWMPTPILAAPDDGNWSGTTNRGYSVTFVVDPPGTQWSDFRLKTPFDFGYCHGTLEVIVGGPGTITSDSFGWTSSAYSFSGQFTSPYVANGTYAINNLYINNPSCNGYVTASGTWTASAPPTFSDVPISHWAHDWIERLYNAGITGGCSTNPLSYCPSTAVSRAQMAVFLLKGIHGSSYTPPAATGSVFSDVPASYWAAAWIEQLAAEGITGGCGTGIYCPETTVTRDQMAVFLLRAKYGSGYAPLPATGAVFSDVPASYWAAAWIEQLAAEGITGGCSTGLYCPTNSVTRDQMSVFLVKTFNLP